MSDRPTVPALSTLILDVLGAAQPAGLSAVGAAPDPARVVELTGAAAGETVTAPLSGRPCVWFRSVTSPFREYIGYSGGGRVPRVVPPVMVPSSAYPPAEASAKPGDRQQVEESTAPLRLRTGDIQLRVDPTRVLIDAAEVTINDYRRDETGRATALLQEWIIAPGAQLHAFGALDGDPAAPDLVAGPAPAAIVSSHDRDYLSRRARLGLRVPTPARLYAVILTPVLLAAVLIVLLLVGVL